jgi:hypothetical protein
LIQKLNFKEAKDRWEETQKIKIMIAQENSKLNRQQGCLGLKV